MPPKSQEALESSRTHLARSLQLAEESKQIGVNTIIKLDGQSEQMKRIKADAEDTEHIVKGNRGVVKDMRRNWVVRLCCYNRSDIVPDDVNWDNRGSPEEQIRVKKMIKLDKRRRQMRRIQRKKEAKEGEQGESAAQGSSKSSSWKFWKKKTSDDDDSDLSDISEESDAEPVQKQKGGILPSRPAAQVASAQFSNGSDDIIFPDEDTALDQLHNTVQDLKVIAMQISETANQQTQQLGAISEQVNKNQSQLDRNNALIGKLGRTAKDDGDDGILSAQDKLAIMGVKSAISAKLGDH